MRWAPLVLLCGCVYQHPAPTISPPVEMPRQEAVITIASVSGVDEAQATTWLAPALPQIQLCRPTRAGALTIDVSGTPEGTMMRIDEATVLDDVTRACVMRALGLVDEDSLDVVLLPTPEGPSHGSPSDTLPSMTSTITITW